MTARQQGLAVVRAVRWQVRFGSARRAHARKAVELQMQVQRPTQSAPPPLRNMVSSNTDDAGLTDSCCVYPARASEKQNDRRLPYSFLQNH